MLVSHCYLCFLDELAIIYIALQQAPNGLNLSEYRLRTVSGLWLCVLNHRYLYIGALTRLSFSCIHGYKSQVWDNVADTKNKCSDKM